MSQDSVSAASALRNQIHGGTDLEETDIHHILSNQRRQLTLTYLRQSNSCSLRDLSTWIAEVESNTSPPPTSLRESVYISLHQNHLPKLDSLDIIEYDEGSKWLELRPRAWQVMGYREAHVTPEFTWRQYYWTVASLGYLCIIAAAVGVPGFAQVGSLPLTGAFLAVLLVSYVYEAHETDRHVFAFSRYLSSIAFSDRFSALRRRSE